MIWTEVKTCTGGVQWEAYPSDTHAIDIWPHEKEGFSWCVITDNVGDNAPEGWSATLDDAKRHAAAAYTEWVLGQPNGTAEFLAQLHALEEKLAHAQAELARERAAVVAWLREQDATIDFRPRVWPMAEMIERGDHRREEGS